GNGETTGGGGSVRLGARATFRVVERLDQEWAPPLAFPSPDRFAQPEEEWRSYDFVLDLGDVRIAAPRPEPRGGSLRPADFSAGPVLISPGVSLVPRVQARNWALYEEVENVRTTTSSRAGLDMDLFIPSARLRLGWRYEGELESPLLRGGRMTVAGMEYQLDSRAQAVAGVAFSDKEEGATRTTQLGLRYELGRN